MLLTGTVTACLLLLRSTFTIRDDHATRNLRCKKILALTFSGRDSKPLPTSFDDFRAGTVSALLPIPHQPFDGHHGIHV